MASRAALTPRWLTSPSGGVNDVTDKVVRHSSHLACRLRSLCLLWLHPYPNPPPSRGREKRMSEIIVPPPVWGKKKTVHEIVIPSAI